MENEIELMDYIMRMKRKARRGCSGAAKRTSYTDSDRRNAMLLLGMVERRGGTLREAAEIISVNPVTLASWLDKFTKPDSDWQMRDQAVFLRNALEVV